MSDLRIPGAPNNPNTTYIRNLVEAERTLRIGGLETQKTELTGEKEIWQGLNRRLNAFRESARRLYGFDNPFLNKIGSSDQPGALTVSAARSASNGSWDIQVIRPASGDRFLSAELPLDQAVPAGDYRIKAGTQEIALNFRGGRLNSFVEALNQRGTNQLRASVVRTSSTAQVMTLEGLGVGRQNSLDFNPAAKELFTSLGLVRPARGGAEGALTDAPVVLEPGQNRNIPLPGGRPLSPGTVLEARVKVEVIDPATLAPATPPLPGLPLPEAGSVAFEGITLSNEGFQLPLPRPTPPPPPADRVDGQVWNARTDAGLQSLSPLEDRPGEQILRVPLGSAGAQLNQIDLANNNTLRRLTFEEIRLTDPSRTGDWEPVRALSRAGDAELEIGGVRLTRPTNAVDDVVPGVTFTLRAPTEGTAKVTVEPDRDGVKDAIITFVGNYNRTLTDLLIYTSVASNRGVLDEATWLTEAERTQATANFGRFQGDITLNQLRSRLAETFMRPYPTDDGSGLNLLAQVGISTNSTPGGRLDASRLRGFLEIDEAKLDKSLADQFESVRRLFGNDTTGDQVVNAGAAHAVDEYLRPYTQLGGFLATRIAGLDSRVKSTDDRIRREEIALADYEAKLRRDFGLMESSLRTMDRASNSLQGLNLNNGAASQR